MPRPQRARRVASILSMSVALALAACGRSSTSDPSRECTTPADCPGTDTECRVRSCWNGACGFDAAAAGTPIAAQVAGDCRQVQCDGAGGTTSVADDADLPVDANACTTEACVAGVPSSTFVAAGTSCAQSGGVQCDGAGACVTCLDASECPSPPSPCVVPTCTAGACGASNAPDGTVVVADVAGDCRTATTCSAGSAVQLPDDADAPADDGNACTADVCTSGAPSHPPEPSGTPCAQDGGTKCDGAGACLECLRGSDCPSGVCRSGACRAPTCTDTVKNGNETDVDCGGGACPACGVSQACFAAADCTSGYCLDGACLRPAVMYVSPPNGTVAAVSTQVLAGFNVPMDPASLAGQPLDGPCGAATFQLSRDGFATCVATSDAVMAGGGTVAFWTPAAPLATATVYSAKVTAGARSPGGEPITSDVVWSFTTENAPMLPGAVVVSQVYVGGGTAGAVYQYDYVELHNRSAVAVSLADWSVQYASASGTTWQVTPLTGAIPAGGYYLVQEGPQGPAGSPLPVPPDVSGWIQLSATAGKVALVSGTTALTGCPAADAVMDLVGYGSTATCSEGTPTATFTVSQAALRNGSGCQDTSDNAADFAVAAPAPRSSASTAVACGVAANGSGLPAEADWCNVESPKTLAVTSGGTSPPVLGLLYEAGLTEVPGSPMGVLAQLGYGPAETDPRTDGGWRFFPASWVAGGNLDEYQASFTTPAAGSWSYTYRFSLDGTITWTYCDVDGAGSSAGFTFDLSQLGQMTVTP